MVKTIRFVDQEVPVPGFGAMGISFAFGSNLTYDEAEPILLKALELGCTFWDTAASTESGHCDLLLIIFSGVIPSRGQRENLGRLYQKTRRAGQDLQCVCSSSSSSSY
jgi:aryl-alcohol dehydrogenase-like predicted oxidoreductase